MAGVQVVRMAKRTGVGGNLGKHIDGASRPLEAEPRPGLDPVVQLEGDRERARQAIEDGRKIRTRGRKPAPAVEFVIAGPPPYESNDGKARPWSEPVVKQWARESVEWVKRHAGPDSVVAHAALHQDERSPHVHVMIVPRDGDGRLGWNRIRDGFGITGKERGPQLMSALQDSYQREVGDRFGLGRGEKGSQRKHQEIDRQAGFLERALAGGFRGFGKSQLQQTLELARDRIRELETGLAKLRADNLRLEQRYHRVEDQVMKLATRTREGQESAIRERFGRVLDEMVRRAEAVLGRRFTPAEGTHVRNAVRDLPLTPQELQAHDAQRRRDRVQRGSSWDLQRKARDVTRGRDDDLGPSR